MVMMMSFECGCLGLIDKSPIMSLVSDTVVPHRLPQGSKSPLSSLLQNSPLVISRCNDEIIRYSCIVYSISVTLCQ